jgi:predicted acylesterase/phospholipase RssA
MAVATASAATATSTKLPVTGSESLSQLCAPGDHNALVLSGGGAKGAFEVGAVYHLIVHRHCDFQDISGVSVGALNGAILAQAATDGDSTKNMEAAARDLLNVWLGLKGNDDIYKKRFLGMFGFALFGRESVYDSEPLARLIAKKVNPTQIGDSGRAFRVGIVSMNTGIYHEILAPTSEGDDRCRLNRDGKFRAAILASASMPALFPKVYIRNVDSIVDCDNDVARKAPADRSFEGFVDGGTSHITPIAGYFLSDSFSPTLRFIPESAPPDQPVRPRDPPIIPHEVPGHIQELFAVLASAYDPYNACPTNEAGCVIDNKDLPSGLGWLNPLLGRLLNSPQRWDVNYATTAQQALIWHDAERGDSQELVQFPIHSANDDAAYSQFVILSPVHQPIPIEDSLDFSPSTIAKSIELGCLAANARFVANGAYDMAAKCANLIGGRAPSH